jgi:hypothetical protein
MTAISLISFAGQKNKIHILREKAMEIFINQAMGAGSTSHPAF